VDPSEFHDMDPITIPHIDNNLDWVNAPIPAPISIFQTPSPIAEEAVIARGFPVFF